MVSEAAGTVTFAVAFTTVFSVEVAVMVRADAASSTPTVRVAWPFDSPSTLVEALVLPLSCQVTLWALISSPSSLAVNSRVLELLEADGGLARFPEGEVMMGEDGRPSGILTENAGKAARDLIAEPDKEMRKKLLLDAMEYAAAHGITSVQSNDAGTVIMDTSAAFQILHEIYDEGRGKIRYRHQTAFHSLKEFQDYLRSTNK